MIVGIDPSLTSTGLCITDPRTMGSVSTPGFATTIIKSIPVEEQDDPVITTYDRCSDIMGKIDTWLLQFPHVGYEFFIEGPAPGPHAHSHLLEMGIWYSTFLYRFRGVPNVITVIHPMRLKKFLGKGNLSKHDVPIAIFKRWGAEFKNDPGRDQAHAFALWKLGQEIRDGKYSYETTKRRGSGGSYRSRKSQST